MPKIDQGRFSFKLESVPTNNLQVKLVNSIGQTIEIRTVDETIEEFDISDLSKGIYHLRITSEDHQKSEKIIVQ